MTIMLKTYYGGAKLTKRQNVNLVSIPEIVAYLSFPQTKVCNLSSHIFGWRISSESGKVKHVVKGQ